MSTIDQISRRRPGLLLTGALAFAVWQATEIGFVRQAADGPALRLIAPVAILFWICSMVPLLPPVLKRSEGRVEDELTRHNRLTAFSWGYWIMILAGAAALAAATRSSLPSVDLIRLMLIGGVAAPMVRFALLERPVADGE